MHCVCWVTDMQVMYPKSPHVSGRTARCPRSESRAPLAAHLAQHASLPHSNASMKPAHVEVEKPTLDIRSFMTGPALNATPAELLPSAVYLISPTKNRTPPPLLYLLLHHFVHSYNGLGRVVIQHPSRLGSPSDTSYAAR